jgi:dihydrofolate reductase / thymidylate synthase
MLTTTNRNLCLIVAIDSRNGISRSGQIPWHFMEDYNFFQDVTCRQNNPNNRNAVIFGKNTWNALPEISRSLPNRINLVVSRNMTFDEINMKNTTKAETHLFNNIPNVLNYCDERKIENIFLCGGKSIYDEALKTCDIDRIFLTRIGHNYDCDIQLAKDLVDAIPTKYTLQSQKKLSIFDKSINKNVEITFDKFYRSLQIVNNAENQYLDIIESIIKTGNRRQTRNAITYSKFGETLKFDLKDGFPLLTTKKVFLRGIFEELIFFLKGDTNSTHLSLKGVKIWEPNTTREFLDSVGLKHYVVGDIGAMYGHQLKHFNAEYTGSNTDYTGKGVDQISYCMELLKKDPYSRRIVMTTYNPLQAFQGVLFPCHGLTVLFNVEDGHRLSCMMTQRSADYICGIPFNIASYALLIHLMCDVLNNDETYTGPKFSLGRLIMNLGDTHIYEEHLSAAKRQLLRDPYQFPKLSFKRKITDLTEVTFDDILLTDYISYPALSVKMVA